MQPEQARPRTAPPHEAAVATGMHPAPQRAASSLLSSSRDRQTVGAAASVAPLARRACASSAKNGMRRRMNPSTERSKNATFTATSLFGRSDDRSDDRRITGLSQRAEADGNRTRRTRVAARPIGFEVRAGHQPRERFHSRFY